MADLPNPVGFYFGRRARACFGWWHQPAGLGRDAVAVVCSPFGREEVCAHATLRRIATELARTGIPALRFDYPGCGDSAKDELDPTLFDAWIESLHGAADEAKRLAGVSNVVFCGLRIGAALAVQVALQRTDVVALSLVAPVFRGKSYVRELRILEAASFTTSRRRTGSAFESGGYALDQETATAIESIDLRKLARLPAPAIQVIEATRIAANDAWIEHMRELGADATHDQSIGYQDMMQDPQDSRVAVDIVDKILAFVSKTVRTEERGLRRGVPPTCRETELGQSSERAVEVNCSGASLSGVLTLPRVPRPSGEAVLLLNAGATRRTGPGRMYVSLARQLAHRGYAVLRFDLSGLGDSAPRLGYPENVVYSKTAVDEVRAAVSYLRDEVGVQRVVVTGLCSGAYHAFKAAVRGVPIDGVIAINPLTFFRPPEIDTLPSPGSVPAHEALREMARYRSDVFHTGRWLRLVRGQVDLRQVFNVFWQWLKSASGGPLRDIARLFRLPLQQDLAREISSLLAKEITLQFLFAEGDPGQDLLQIQGGAVVTKLRRQDRFLVKVVADSNHTFTAREAREEAIASLLEFAERSGRSRSLASPGAAYKRGALPSPSSGFE